MEFVGVRVVEQLGDDWARAGRKKKPSKAAKETGDIPKKATKKKASISGSLNVQQKREKRQGHARE